MKLSRIVLAVILGVCASLTLLRVQDRVQAQSATSLIFQTTFNCPDWSQVGGLDPCAVNDGIQPAGGWTGSSGRLDVITAAANNPLGSGKGFRHMRDPGTNSNGGGIRIIFPPTGQIWMRFYMRYSAGFSWQYGHPHYTKDINWNVGEYNYKLTGFGDGYFYLHNPNGGSQNLHSSDTWANINGGPVGDGKFHAYETYIKMDTNGSNGELKLWRDGNLVLTRTGLNYGGGTLSSFLMGSNQSYVTSTGSYTDYDDVAISYTGYIGPIGGSAPPQPTGPAAPSNLRITN
jgi:hypothetical protein